MDKFSSKICNLLLKKHTKNPKEFDFMQTEINDKELKLGIKYKVFYLKTIIKNYKLKEKFLCYYDVDIINYILDFILENNKKPRFEDRKICIIDKLYDLIGYYDLKPNYQKYKKTQDYFTELYHLLDPKIKENFISICENIFFKFSI